ncbi:hypothetical protein PTKIN_Ptkin04bG0235300 [Pterospermum kingtungense]
MDPAGKEGQNPDGTQPNPNEKLPQSMPGQGEQSSEGKQASSGEQTKSISGNEKQGQNPEGTQPQNPEGTQPNPNEQLPQSTPAGQGEQSSEGKQANSGEQAKSSSGKGEQSTEGKQADSGEQAKSTSETGPTTAKPNKDDAKKILDKLAACPEAVVLTGDAGTGKTWLAREVTKSAVSKQGGKDKFYMSLWISVKKEHKDDYKSVHQSLALQLSIPTGAGVWEDVNENDDSKKKDYAVSQEDLRPKVAEKLDEKRKEMQEKKIEEGILLLLVLDSEGELKTKDYNHIIKELFPPKIHEHRDVKILITTRHNEEFISSHKDQVVEVMIHPFSGEEAVSFLKQRVPEEKISKHPKFQSCCDEIQKRREVLPAQIIMFAEALNRTANGDSEALKSAFDAAHNMLKHAKEDDPIPLLQFAYEKLPEYVIDCFWHSWNFLGTHGGVQYNELIAHWILEGHLDLSAGVKTAYERGYHVMMELIDRGMLKMQEDNLIVLEGATLFLDDRSCRGLFEKSNLGLASGLEDDKFAVLERMAPDDGMMRTVGAHDKAESLLIDGSRLRREVTNKFFEAKKNLRVLALFYPRLTSLPESISGMNSLLVLVLRDCYLFNDIKGIEKLEKLQVLEISGAPFLEEMPDELFEKMSQLRILNLSELGIKSLPPSFSKLSEIRRLILRKCTFLTELPKLVNLKNLEVIDLSGSSSLIKIQEKSFKSFKELRFIDFSETKIEKLPIVQTLPKLAVLLVRECDRLYGLRSMKHLPSLRVYDVSGATRIKEIYYDTFDNTKSFRTLDLSKTEIRFLPDTLGELLCDLKLKACPKLEKLPNTKDLTNLESLDLSHCSALKKYPDNFFGNLPSLRSLNLSNTKVPSLPSLPNLRRLLLKDCLLEKFPVLEGCTFLEELDLSNCKIISADHLAEVADLTYDMIIIKKPDCYKPMSEIGTSFEHMSWLQTLNLSETDISSLPPLPNPSKLHSLTLKNCTKLQSLPDFKILPQLKLLDLQGTTSLGAVKAESLYPLTQLRTLKLSNIAVDGGNKSSLSENLKQLKVLDVSGEAVKSLPSLDGLSTLLELLLGGCSSLEELPSLDTLSQLEVLDLSRTKVKKIREKISKLTHLKRLHLPEEAIEEFKGEGSINFPPLELNLDHCCISKSSDIPEGDKKPKIVVQGTELFESLKKDPALLESIRNSISSVRSQCKDEDSYGDSRKHMFGDVYTQIRKLGEAKDGQSLEIHGFDKFPTGIEVVLDHEHINYVLLVENNFLNNLSDLKPCSLEKIKGFWFERCNKMESIFLKADIGKWENLQILWISNLPKLKGLYDEKVESQSFGNLKKLYIDCCPMLETVFSFRQIPGNLETLQIMFCDKLKTLVGDEDPANREAETAGSADKKAQTTSPATREGPTTSSADKKVPATSSDNKAQAKSSDKKGQTEKEEKEQTKSSDKKGQTEKEEKEQTKSSTATGNEVLPKATSSDKKGQTEKEEKEQTKSSTATGTEVLPKATSSDKKGQTEKEEKEQTKSSTATGNEVLPKATSSAENEAQMPTTPSAGKQEQTTSRSNLKYLHVSYCPMLETVFSSAQPPKNLEVLQIKFCDRLKSLCRQELVDYELPNLHTLHLLELPGWKTGSDIGLKLNKSVLKNDKVSRNIQVECLRERTASKEITEARGN